MVIEQINYLLSTNSIKSANFLVTLVLVSANLLYQHLNTELFGLCKFQTVENIKLKLELIISHNVCTNWQTAFNVDLFLKNHRSCSILADHYSDLKTFCGSKCFAFTNRSGLVDRWLVDSFEKGHRQLDQCDSAKKKTFYLAVARLRRLAADQSEAAILETPNQQHPVTSCAGIPAEKKLYRWMKDAALVNNGKATSSGDNILFYATHNSMNFSKSEFK